VEGIGRRDRRRFKGRQRFGPEDGPGRLNAMPDPRTGSWLTEVLDLAARAPSGHNAQPWLVRVGEPGRLVIVGAGNRRLPAVDPANRELLLSIGTFLENLIVAARHYGHELEYRVIAGDAMDTDLVELRDTSADAVPFPLDRIRKRRVVREPHSRRELSAGDVAALSQAAGDSVVFISATSAAGKYLRDGTVEAMRVQTCRDAAQEELSRWIRVWDPHEHRRNDGLTPKALGISGLAGWYVGRFMRRESVMKKGFRNATVDMARRQVRSLGGWLVVSSPDSRPATLVETGRKVERMLLGVRDRMIAVHPMSQMLEETPFREDAARALGISGAMQFILRAGYLNRYPDPVSPRRPASSFIVGPQG